MTAAGPSRRAVLKLAGGSSLVAGAGPGSAGAAPGADDELVRLCCEFDVLQQRKLNLHQGGATPIIDDAERMIAVVPLEERQEELLAPILASRATTPAGFMARARMAALWCDWQKPPSADDSWDDAMLQALVRDMIGKR